MKKFFAMFAILFLVSFSLFACDETVDPVDPTINEFSITFVSNGGSLVSSITDDEDASISKPVNPTKDGYTFSGWYSDSNLSSAVQWPYTLVENVTFYAKWEEIDDQITYTVTWEVNGIVVETDINVLENSMPTYDGTNPTKIATAQYEYTFTGWNPAIAQANSDQTYVAVFSENLRSYDIEFNSNGGTQVTTINQDYGTTLAEPNEPTKEGYNFVSWCLDSNLTQEVVWPIDIEEDQTLYAKWNEIVEYGSYLSSLLSSYSQNPYDFIPDSMKPGSELITQQQSDIDYLLFVNLTSVPSGGYGEQWNMVVSNLEQSQTFFTLLTVVDTLSSASVTAFNNYIDTNPEDKANYEFLSGIYTVTISYEAGVMNYIIDYTQTLPVFGQETIQIALSLDILSGEKVGRIQIGDANALKYVVSEDSYQFAIKYLGFRRAYFEVSRDDDDNVEGRIFEYLGIDESFTTGSAAEFFIDDDYVSVVGNKSSSMMGWTGTISELYDATSGSLLGYEVRETLSSITYNSLWFNLSDTSGITTIKFDDAPIEDSNPYLVYVNGSSSVFESMNFGGFSTKTLSRRYDIELRTQYFYYQDGDEVLEVAVEIPMIFVQQEKLPTLVTDVNSTNSGLSFTLDVSLANQTKIINNYETLVDAFIAQKDDYTTEAIITFIGPAYN